MNAFFAMSGYGFYIWSAYGACGLALAIELVLLRARRRAALAQARSTASEGGNPAAGERP